MSWAEIIGYLASAGVVLSFAMKSVIRLRIVSMVGSVLYIIYGIAIGAWPVVITNVFVVALNAWNLWRELRGPKDMNAIDVPADSPFVTDFVRVHAGDIAKHQPSFAGGGPDDLALLLHRDGVPAGLVTGRQDGEEFHVGLDYVLPEYRDSKLGAWLYGDKSPTLWNRGVRRVVARPDAGDHESYLTGVGFVRQGDRMVKELSGRAA